MTSERRRSCAAEPVNAIFEVADISSMLPTFVSAPDLICFLPFIIFQVFSSFRSSRNFFCGKRLFLPLSTYFLIFSSVHFFEFIVFHRQQHTIFTFQVETKKGVFFSFYLFSKIIPLWRWFCFFVTCRCCLRRLSRWIRWWWWLNEFSADAGITGTTTASFKSTSWELPPECFFFVFPLTNSLHITTVWTYSSYWAF